MSPCSLWPIYLKWLGLDNDKSSKLIWCPEKQRPDYILFKGLLCGMDKRQCVCLTICFCKFPLLTRKNSHENASQSTRTILEVDTYCDLWKKNHVSIGMLEIEMTHITRQLQLKDPWRDHTPLHFITTCDKKFLPYIICHR